MIKLRLILYHASPLRHRWRDATSPKVRGLGSPRNVSGFAKGSPFGKDFPRSGENGKAKKGNSWRVSA